jgi:hypothetical protein
MPLSSYVQEKLTKNVFSCQLGLPRIVWSFAGTKKVASGLPTTTFIELVFSLKTAVIWTPPIPIPQPVKLTAKKIWVRDGNLYKYSGIRLMGSRLTGSFG